MTSLSVIVNFFFFLITRMYDVTRSPRTATSLEIKSVHLFLHQPQPQIAHSNALNNTNNTKQWPKKRRKFPNCLPRRRSIFSQPPRSKKMLPRSLQQRPLDPQPHQLNHPLHLPSQILLNRTRTRLSRHQSLPSHRQGHLPLRLSLAMPLLNASNP